MEISGFITSVFTNMKQVVLLYKICILQHKNDLEAL
jgi:hypothetical protein